jgi:hypothetical protein
MKRGMVSVASLLIIAFCPPCIFNHLQSRLKQADRMAGEDLLSARTLLIYLFLESSV